MDFKNRIVSLQEATKIDYTRPDVERLRVMQESLKGSPAWDYLIDKRKLTEETIAAFGLGYDEEKGAVAIPQYKDGELINIKYRMLDGRKTRYLGEPNAEPWLFNEDGVTIGIEKGAVAIAEGEFDCMSLWQLGFKNVISPGFGANSYGAWLEELDKVKQVWIAYDNDEPGQTAAKELASRIGIDKCRNVLYPEGIKDANEFLQEHDGKELRTLFAKAKPFYKQEFNNLSDIVDDMISNPKDYLTSRLIPDVKIYKDNLTVVTGVTNAGKSTYALNVALELAGKGVPVLILPLERGPMNVGRRLIQVALNKTEDDIEFTPHDELRERTQEIIQLPIFFAMPDRSKLLDVISRAKRLFDVQYVIIDQIDQAVRNIGGNKEQAISDTMRDIKRLTESLPIAIMIVSHIRKLAPGERISIDALKGSNSLSTDPETVILLESEPTHITVDVAKNKGKMTKRPFHINHDTGVIGNKYDPDDF
jgi:twinkle protein